MQAFRTGASRVRGKTTARKQAKAVAFAKIGCALIIHGLVHVHIDAILIKSMAIYDYLLLFYAIACGWVGWPMCGLRHGVLQVKVASPHRIRALKSVPRCAGNKRASRVPGAGAFCLGTATTF